MRPRVFVVEGKNDEMKIKKLYPHAEVITTRGSAMNTFKTIIALDETHDVYLCLDPDDQGDRIRHRLGQHLKHAVHVLVPKEKARSRNGKKIGIEHTDDQTLLDAIEKYEYTHQERMAEIDIPFLVSVGLIGQQASKVLRGKVAKKMNLGIVNGKTLCHRLNLFRVTRLEVIEVLNEVSS